jgi:hypothetical protein
MKPALRCGNVHYPPPLADRVGPESTIQKRCDPIRQPEALPARPQLLPHLQLSATQEGHPGCHHCHKWHIDI